MKLQLFISHNSDVSRRKAFDHVLAGDVTVNGMVIREPSHMIEPGEDKIVLLGREIKPRAYEYIMLNKPAGVVTTCEAQFDQRGVMSVLPPNLRHLKPVGRLDKDTEGLLVLTNDGALANRLAHPSFDVNKTYHVRVQRRMEYREKDRLEQGVVIENFKTAPAKVENMQFHGGFTEFDLTIHEGHKHQVRLMCHEVGHDVVDLVRIAQGPLKLEGLKSGEWRALTGEELALLRAVGRPVPVRWSPPKPGDPRPVFRSHSGARRFSANRDWHSREAKVERPERPREEDRPRREEAPRREYKPYRRDDRDGAPRKEYTPYRRDEREGAVRKEYKPYDRDARSVPERKRFDRPRPAGYVRRDDKPPAEGSPRREYKPYRRDDREGSARREYKPYRRDDRDGAPRKEYKPYRRDDRDGAPRKEYKPYRRDDRDGASRKEYKPYSRDTRPGFGRPRTEGPSRDGRPAYKPYKKPFGKKPYRKSI